MNLRSQGGPGGGGAPDPSDVADEVERLMARDEFRYDPSLFDRLTDWIGDRLDSLFGTGSTAPGAAFGGGVPSIVAWAMILVAAALVGAVIWYAVRNRIARPEADDHPVLEVEVLHRRSASEWAEDASRHERAREWKLALRARYRQLVRTLVDREQLPDVAGLTTGELRVELGRRSASAEVPFDQACELFELVWYADAPAGEAEVDRLRRLSDEVLAASSADGRRRQPVGAA